MSKRKSKHHNTQRKILCGNRLQQLEVACGKRLSAYTLPTIPEICKRIFFSVKVIILTSLRDFVHQATSKASEQLARMV